MNTCSHFPQGFPPVFHCSARKNKTDAEIKTKGVFDMIRGTQKAIFEVVDLQNPYFEKAILFLKIPQDEENALMLESKAKEYVSSIEYKPLRSKQKWLKRLWSFAKWAMTVAIIILILSYLA